MATILIENLTKVYPPTATYPQQVQALSGVSMSVTGNVFVAVLGPSSPPPSRSRSSRTRGCSFRFFPRPHR